MSLDRGGISDPFTRFELNRAHAFNEEERGKNRPTDVRTITQRKCRNRFKSIVTMETGSLIWDRFCSVTSSATRFMSLIFLIIERYVVPTTRAVRRGHVETQSRHIEHLLITAALVR